MSTEIFEAEEHPAFSQAVHSPTDIEVITFSGPETLATIYHESRMCVNIILRERGRALNAAHVRLTEKQALDMCRAITKKFLPEKYKKTLDKVE